MKGMQKIKRGKSFAGVVLYALKPGKHHKTDPVVIGRNMLGDSATDLIAEFCASASLRSDVAKPVWHNSLRLPIGESLTTKQWVSFADDYMNRMGFSETHLRCYIIHDDEAGQHIHIIASRVDLIGGKLYLGRNENLISTRVIQELEIAHELTKTKGPSPSHSPSLSSKRKRLSRNEEQKEKREGQPTPKTFLQNTIDEILTNANDISGFVEALAENGIATIPNISSTDRMNGFSFEYSGIAFKASQLGKSYSWANLQKKLLYEPERDNPLLLTLKASAMGGDETSDSVIEAAKVAITPSLPAALEFEGTPPPVYEHRARASETTEAQTLLDMTRKPSEQTRIADFFMTRVLSWLLSIPYLATFIDLLKKAGKTFLHQKSSFATIHTVLLAEPELSEPLASSEILTERAAVPFR
ncbi:relaxase/mobilization nuclease domain-containing protein [Pantoea sp. B623]|uniref:relaxase/mobilization nuclease domain-containing protein n=1 Tax=Pantoea TaxID=53335 RepID=UPI000E375098|nr:MULTISPECIES: relaxase/mobilization nuclease domain-containing protein [Pantoea]MCS3402490.1 relaxase/mobilization nuclease domain-containing protein [Pantoea sp. B566]MCS4493673.1 relaxase/mobilization nuclease domain-containing protein [Pantoea sp. B623]REF11545.1 relaxase/mobilization nuclease-like protein [Pantoea ananatis]